MATLHRAAAEPAPVDGVPPIVHDVLRSPGQPLDLATRGFMEPRFGHDFSHVHVHADPGAAGSAVSIGARAYTVGHHVVFGAGEYRPGTADGRRLLAHELSHVVAAPGRTPVLARVALTAADFDALADSLHDAITTATADEELIYVALQKLERDATAITTLEAAYLKRHKTKLLTALGSRLKGHALGLAKRLLGATSGLKLATKPPSAAKDYEAAARAVNGALVAKPVDPEGVYAALLPLARDASRATTMKTTYAKLFTTGLEADLTAKLTGADLSYALYLLNAPGPASAHSPAIFSGPLGFGTAPATAPPAAAGGTVSAGTQVPYTTTKGMTGTYGFGVGYKGALSSDSRWLQFIEREIDSVPKGGGKAVALNKEITASSGAGTYTYKLTTVSTSPQWNVDGTDPSNPFFDETHSRDTWRDATSVAIYDSPQARDDLVNDRFSVGATAVTSRAHFEIYLIRDFSAIYHIEIEIIWTYSAPGKKTISRTVKAAGSVSSLPSALRAALVARYPAYAYIR